MSSNCFFINNLNFLGQSLMHQAAASENIGVIEALNIMDASLKN